MRRSFPVRSGIPLLGSAMLAAFALGCSETPNLSISLKPGREPPDAPPPIAAIPSIAIRTPAPGEVIREDVFDAMTGTATGLPSHHQLFTFARDRFRNWFLQYPPPDVRHGGFEQRNIRVTPGDWQLVVCVASADASRQLHADAKRGRYAFHASELPEGVTPVASYTSPLMLSDS